MSARTDLTAASSRMTAHERARVDQEAVSLGEIDPSTIEKLQTFGSNLFRKVQKSGESNVSREAAQGSTFVDKSGKTHVLNYSNTGLIEQHEIDEQQRQIDEILNAQFKLKNLMDQREQLNKQLEILKEQQRVEQRRQASLAGAQANNPIGSQNNSKRMALTSEKKIDKANAETAGNTSKGENNSKVIPKDREVKLANIAAVQSAPAHKPLPALPPRSLSTTPALQQPIKSTTQNSKPSALRPLPKPPAKKETVPEAK